MMHLLPQCGADRCLPMVTANKMPRHSPFRSLLTGLVGHRSNYIYLITRHDPHTIFLLHRVSMDTKQLPLFLSDVARLAWHFARRPIVASGMLDNARGDSTDARAEAALSAAKLAELFPVEHEGKARKVRDTALRSGMASRSEAESELDSPGGTRVRKKKTKKKVKSALGE
eukprot:TRINITY_DN4335_c0_g1_i1.p2 TRINITY_DN4335_c0_g1~~TRINITY_DN4335_c0_g1_i1.p2  ORF type:complete len:171 (-),score=93.34 TRINITY_DN4335_c0_g1_i1:67-579(-)